MILSVFGPLVRAPVLLAVAVVTLASRSAFAERPSCRDAAAFGAARDSVRIPILVYHNVAPHHSTQTRAQREFDVDPDTFERQMRLLVDNGYTVIPLARLVDIIVDGAPVPPRAVVITFDDGWATQYHHAYPVLSRLHLPATFFVFTAPIGHDPRFMTWDQLREMRDSGMNIGSHSRTHPTLAQLERTLRKELTGSRADIARELGTAAEFFAYPFGATNSTVMDAVREAGYRAARGFGGGSWNDVAHRWRLRTAVVTNDMAAFRRTVRLPDERTGATPGPSRRTRPPVRRGNVRGTSTEGSRSTRLVQRTGDAGN